MCKNSNITVVLLKDFLAYVTVYMFTFIELRY